MGPWLGCGVLCRCSTLSDKAWPPLMMSRRIQDYAAEKWAFVEQPRRMTVIFAALTAIWLVPGIIEPHTGLITWLIPLLYLVLYAAFFYGGRRQPAHL